MGKDSGSIEKGLWWLVVVCAFNQQGSASAAALTALSRVPKLVTLESELHR